MPEPDDQQPGPFQSLWTALCAPVDLPLLTGRWVPLYAILALQLVVLLVALFFIGRSVGISRRRRRILDRLARMEQPEPSELPEVPEPAQPEAPDPALAESEPAPVEPESPAPEVESATPEEPEAPAPEAESAAPEEPETPESEEKTLDRESLDALLEEIRNM